MPTVSVIIPTYNRASMVKEAIQSVLGQTYSDYEIIAVDDGSTDNTREIVNAFSDKKIRYVFQENRGRSNARNHAINIAWGRYIAFLDSDDLFMPIKLERQVAFMENNPDILLSHTSYLRINNGGEYIEEVKSGTFSGKVYLDMVRRCPIATPTVMVRTAALGENIRFEEGIHIGEDIILWAQLARLSKILGIDEPLTKIRINPSSAAVDPKTQIIGVMNIMEYIIRRHPELPFLVRHKLLSDGYFNIGFNYLRAREITQFLRFLVLAIFEQPFNPPFFVMRRLSTVFNLKSIDRGLEFIERLVLTEQV
jgi:glycosyltransferase involved in cell wall biosynthesis